MKPGRGRRLGGRSRTHEVVKEERLYSQVFNQHTEATRCHRKTVAQRHTHIHTHTHTHVHSNAIDTQPH